jgi:hypothetical protein
MVLKLQKKRKVMRMWSEYKVAFRLLSPLHIGRRKVGNLQQTRRYVPGKVLWAAFTARLVRDSGKGDQNSAYVDMGNFIHDNVRFGYFYLALSTSTAVESADDLKEWYPWSTEHFDYIFLQSYTSTGLGGATKTAEKGSLHEIEFISPQTRWEDQVYLLGTLWVREECSKIVMRKNCLGSLQLGGERGYGWGRIEPVFAEPVFALEVAQRNNQDIVIPVKKGEKVLAHVDACGVQEGLRGRIEPLVGWEYTGNGWNLTENVVLAYVPGSDVVCDMTFVVDRFGLWKV